MNPEATVYTHLALKVRETARQIADEYFTNLPFDEGERILDVACGSGETTKGVLLPACPKTINKLCAFDFSESMIEKAKTENGDEIIDYRVGNFDDRTSLPAEWEGAFDKVFSHSAIHLSSDPKEAIRTVYRLLKPGGYFVLAMLVKAMHWDIADMLHKRPHWQPHCQINRISKMHFIDGPEEVVKMWFKDVGFRVIRMNREPSIQVLDTREQYEVTLRSANPFYADIPENLIQQWVKEFALEAEKVTGGRYEFRGEQLIVIAQKPE